MKEEDIQKKDFIIQEMKKSIAQYRKEIINLETLKKVKNHKNKRESELDNRRIPKLDLSKVKRDSDSEDSNENGNKEKYYHQYEENESENENESVDESKESFMR